jgi:hypothetical protein
MTATLRGSLGICVERLLDWSLEVEVLVDLLMSFVLIVPTTLLSF